MRRLRLSPAAEDDLSAIWDYSLARWGRAQAKAYVTVIRGRAEGLASGTVAARKADAVRPGYVVATAGSHHLWCRMTDDSVLVMRILHQSMDVNRQL